MVFDKYSRQAPAKPASSEPSKPAGGSSSSYLSRLAGQVGAGGSSSGLSGAGKTGGGFAGNSQIWSGSPGDKAVKASIEKRLHWVETAFKKGEERHGVEDSKVILSGARNRINALLTYDLPPKVRSELELIDKELNKLL